MLAGLFVGCGFLLIDVRFRSVQQMMGPVGHTHNGLDQRFSVVFSSLDRAKTLETVQVGPLPNLKWNRSLCLTFAGRG